MCGESYRRCLNYLNGMCKDPEKCWFAHSIEETWLWNREKFHGFNISKFISENKGKTRTEVKEPDMSAILQIFMSIRCAMPSLDTSHSESFLKDLIKQITNVVQSHGITLPQLDTDHLQSTNALEHLTMLGMFEHMDGDNEKDSDLFMGEDDDDNEYKRTSYKNYSKSIQYIFHFYRGAEWPSGSTFDHNCWFHCTLS